MALEINQITDQELSGEMVDLEVDKPVEMVQDTQEVRQLVKLL